MRATAALVGLVLVLSLVPGFSSARDQTVDFADNSTPPRGPPSYELVVSIIISHSDNVLPEEEFIEVDDLWVKKSNYDGVLLSDRTYYYCLAPHFCSCPACRGILDLFAASLFYRDESADLPMTIYTLDEFEPSPAGIHTLDGHQNGWGLTTAEK